VNQTEALLLVTNLNRGGLLQAMEGQAAVWADALDDIAIADAIPAARRLIRYHVGADRWVTPGDIRQTIGEMRRERIEAVKSTPAPPSELDDNPREGQRWLLGFWRAIGDGLTEAEASSRADEELGVTRYGIERPRPVEQIVQQTADRLPRIPRREEKSA
jgi:hypothetical protein